MRSLLQSLIFFDSLRQQPAAPPRRCDRMASTNAFLAAPAFLRHGVLHFPVAYMRGGTSTGVVLWGPHLAHFADLRDEIIRKIMGVPDAGEAKGNKQITGLGRGPSTSNKVSDGVLASSVAGAD
jgi:hypothetical protein